MQFVFLLIIVLVALKTSSNMKLFMLSLLGFILVWSVAATYVDSRLIDVLRSLHPLQFAIAFCGYLLEAIVFLGTIWFLEKVASSLQGFRVNKRDSCQAAAMKDEESPQEMLGAKRKQELPKNDQEERQ